MQKTFGRRVSFERKYPPPMVEPIAPPPGAAPPFQVSPVDRAAVASSGFLAISEDDELRAWRRARRQRSRLPWRSILLMASVSFGVAALVLPDTVNDNLDWLLYGLMGISFVAGLRRRTQET